MLTNQAYTMIAGDYGSPSLLMVETNLTQFVLENGSLFSEHQTRDIL